MYPACRDVQENANELRIMLCREKRSGTRSGTSVIAACGAPSALSALYAVFPHVSLHSLLVYTTGLHFIVTVQLQLCNCTASP